MSNILAGKTILVTGGTGSIGSEIVRQALEQRANKVIVFSRDEIKHFMMRKSISGDKLQTIVGDVRDLASVERAFNRFNIDIVYHAAAMKHVVMCEDFPLEAVETNILGTQNVAEMALRYGASKMITISTDKAAYPVNVMGATKFVAEGITLSTNNLRKANQAFSCVRFGNVANSRGSVIPVYVEDLLNRNPLQVSDFEVTRFIMEISDAVKLIIKATEYAQGGEIFILKMKAFKLQNLLDIIFERIAPRIGLRKQDVAIITTGLVPGEKLHEDLINHNEMAWLYEMEDMYVILPDSEEIAKTNGLKKVSLSGYSSEDTELISNEDLENIVLKILKMQHPKFQDHIN